MRGTNTYLNDANDYAINEDTGFSNSAGPSNIMLDPKMFYPNAPFEITLEDFHSDKLLIDRIPKTAS